MHLDLPFELPPGTLHVLVILWGLQKYYFPLNQTAESNLQKWISVLKMDRQAFHLKLHPYRTLRKIIKRDFE